MSKEGVAVLMRKILSITAITIVAGIAMTGCEQFSTSYQRVDDSEFRMLKYIWEPADAAPGDTVTLTAVFAGKRVDLDGYLQWWVSYNVIRDLFGNTTVVDSALLNAESRLVEFSPNTQAVEFKIPVPRDIVRNSASIPERWADALPASLKEALPAELASMTKTQLIDMIDSAANNVNAIRKENVAALIPVLQYFTVPMRVFTKINEPGRLPNTITSTQYIRYNNRFKAIGIPVNNAPAVDKVVVYKVKGNDVFGIEDKSGIALDSIILDNSGNSVIEVEKGYSYFLDAQSRNIDTTVTMDGNRILEKYRIYRQFQLDAEETAGIHHSKFMSMDNFNGRITFPTDKRITKFVFWLTVYDEVQNERLRPNGETLVEVSGRLVYK
jgi:hypothetical protein